MTQLLAVQRVVVDCYLFVAQVRAEKKSRGESIATADNLLSRLDSLMTNSLSRSKEGEN